MGSINTQTYKNIKDYATALKMKNQLNISAKNENTLKLINCNDM